MSKMQMLIFATGIVVIAVLFLEFISGIGLGEVSRNIVISAERNVTDRLLSENFCASNSITFPDVLYYGYGDNRPFYYDLIFSSVNLGDYNSLVISITEHGKKNIIASKSVPMKARIVLVDPGFILGENNLNNYYDKNKIILYPRAAYSGPQAAPPNSFISLKEIDNNGEKTVYIVPCSSLLKGAESVGLTNNCTSNLLLVGCHKLKIKSGSSIVSNSLVSDCFSLAVGNLETGTIVNEITWETCKNLFPGIDVS